MSADMATATRPTGVRWQVLGMLVLLSMITYLDRVCINSAGPAIREELGLTTGQMGWVLGVFAIAYGVFEIPGGWMGDRFGPRVVLTRIVVWWSAFTAFTGLVTGYGQILVVRFLFGAGEAGAYPNSSAAISRWLPVEARASAHGVVWLASRIGGALTPFIVAPLIVSLGWRSVFFVFSVLGVVWSVAWYAWFRNSPREKAGVNEAEIELIGAPNTEGHGISVWKILTTPNLWAIMLAYHLFCYGSFWYLSWSASYLEAEKGMAAGTLAAFTALPFVLGAISNGVGGVFSDWLIVKIGLKWGRRLVGAGGVGLAGVLMLVSLGIDDPYWAAGVLALSFAASDFMLPNSWAICLDVGRENAGAVTGAMNTAGQAGSAIMAIAYGGLVETYGWNLPLAGIGVLSILSALMWLVADPTKRLVDS